MLTQHQQPAAKRDGKALRRLPRTDVAQPPGTPGGPPPGFITIREACKRLGRHQQTIYRYIHRGLLRVKLVGWRVFVEEKSVEWWLKPRLYEPRRPAPPWLRKTQRRAAKAAELPEHQATDQPAAPAPSPASPDEPVAPAGTR